MPPGKEEIVNSFYGTQEKLIKHLKIGDVISVEKITETKTIKRDYEVIGIYPYMVRTKEKNKKGRARYRCFSYGDLIQLGYEMQSLDVEVMREASEADDTNRTQYYSGNEV